jgi:hypothetical protein
MLEKCDLPREFMDKLFPDSDPTRCSVCGDNKHAIIAKIYTGFGDPIKRCLNCMTCCERTKKGARCARPMSGASKMCGQHKKKNDSPE